MIRCVLTTMLAIFWKGLIEFLEILLSMAIIIGIPIGIIYTVVKLIGLYFGAEVLAIVMFPSLSAFAIFIFVAMIVSWVKKAIDECESK